MNRGFSIFLISFALLGAGILFQPVAAHGSDDGGMTDTVPTMPGMPDMADMGHMPGHMMDDEAIWLTTDTLTIMAVKEMPAFHFWYTQDDNGAMARFMVSYSLIAEFEDMNGDNAFQFNESIDFAPLSAYEWTVQSGSVEDSNGTTTEIWLKYSKGGLSDEDSHHHMMPGGPEMMHGPYIYDEGANYERFEDVTIQIWAHLYLSDYEDHITDSNGLQTNYSIAGGTELKVDIEIGNFPFSTNTSQVSIQTMLNENMAEGYMGNAGHMFMTHERFHNFNGTSMMNWTTPSGNETLFHGIGDNHMQQIDFIDIESNLTQGFYRWIDQAVITWPGGITEGVNVTTSYVPTGMGLAVFFAYPNFDNGSIVHDPSIGLLEGNSPVLQIPLDTSLTIGFLATIVIISIIAIVTIRKR